MAADYTHPVVVETLSLNDQDISRVVDIWYRTSVVCHNFIAEEFWRTHRADMRNQYIPAAETIIARCQGEIVGFISLVDNLLAALFVLPEFQGRGIGQALLTAAFVRRKELLLNVYEKNTAAIKFYRKNGFRELQKSIDEQTGEAEITMKWCAG